MKKEDKEVFCIDCIYSEILCWEFHVCSHPTNVRWKKDHYSVRRVFKKKAKKLNKYNNCPGFEEHNEEPKPRNCVVKERDDEKVRTSFDEYVQHHMKNQEFANEYKKARDEIIGDE